MAQKVEVRLIDDLDGSEADETVTFGLDSKEYEIDLSAEHAKELRDGLAAFVAAARKAGKRRAGRGSGKTGAGSGTNTAEVREWAKAEGLEVSDRGRIPAELMVKFQQAHSS